MYIKNNRAYFESDDYDLAKELLKKHVVIHAANMGPFGEDIEGITVTGFDVDYADNIENYEGLEGKGWDDLDDEEKEWFDGEDDFEQLNPFWADKIVCVSDNIGQSDVNWADWEMVYEDLWISVPDYRRYVGMKKIDLDDDMYDNTPVVKQRDESVKIKKAKQILESAGYRLLKEWNGGYEYYSCVVTVEKIEGRESIIELRGNSKSEVERKIRALDKNPKIKKVINIGRIKKEYADY